jgi:amidohydrolase
VNWVLSTETFIPMTPAEPQTETDLLIATRRDLHRHPELAFQEHRTAGIVAERLRAAGYDVRTGVAETGVVGDLAGGAGDGPTLVLRADMDALPIQELNAHDYVSSADGLMHACGHDAHVAVGLAVADRLAARREQWAGRIRYVFQPGEEGGGGAKRMVDEGVLEGVDAALGLHVWSPMPAGTVGTVAGPMMGGSLDFYLEVHGRGGHGAIPQETIDATLVASQIVVSLQSIVSRGVSPLDAAVVSVGMLRSGTAENIISEHAYLEGTMRAFRPETMLHLRERVREVAAGVCAAYGARLELRFREGEYPPLINDTGMAELVRRVAVEVVGADKVRFDESVRTMAAEDFSEFLLRVPGCYFFLGCGDEASGAAHPHHSAHFEVCEDVLPLGVEILERAAREFLRGGAPP